MISKSSVSMIKNKRKHMLCYNYEQVFMYIHLVLNVVENTTKFISLLAYIFNNEPQGAQKPVLCIKVQVNKAEGRDLPL